MITAIIPTLNEEEFIEDCLISLKNQTYPIDEIIVIDSGSTDRTVKIAIKYAKVIFGKKNIGYNRELGVNSARNNIILSTDGDTILPENWVEEAIKYFECPDVIGVVGSIKPLNSNLVTEINCLTRNNLFSNLMQRSACFIFRKPQGSSFYSENCRPIFGEFSVIKKSLEGEIIYDKNLFAYTDITASQQINTVLLLTGAGIGMWWLFKKL